jgi:hypothetical protein
MRLKPFDWILSFLFVSGCAHTAGVSTALPVKRVVIYRNGVGYFEREGHVHEDQVQFQVRPSHIDDFLATLSVMEEGGSSVRSASFPNKLESSEKPDALNTVTLHLDGKAHDLTVGYVAEQPIWRPSYRLVVEHGQLSLQAWGIVQNLSGEDWNDVQLSLVAGAPIAFQSTLSKPVTPTRPVVTDSGELIAAVPQSETTLAQTPPGAPPPPAAMAAPAPAEMEALDDSMASLSKSKADMAKPLPPRLMRAAPEMKKRPQDRAFGSANRGSALPSERNRALLATTAVTAGSTRYDLPSPVTVPDQSATLVLLTAQSMPGEAVHMFAPDPGVPDSSRHPFRVARFKNVTSGLLERGPIAVVEAGAFLGQGVLEPLSAGAEATIPFALDRGVAIDIEHNNRFIGARVAQIEAGTLTIERDMVVETKYRVQNGEAESVKVVLRHARSDSSKLHDPPAGTEDQVGKGTALVPVQVKAQSTAELLVDERHPIATQVDWMAPEADEAMQTFFRDTQSDAALVAALKSAWATRTALRTHTDQSEKLSSEKQILSEGSEETRENLAALRKNPAKGVTQLRDKLAARLLQMDNRLAEINKQLIELQLRISEETVRFREAVRDLKLERPTSKG